MSALMQTTAKEKKIGALAFAGDFNAGNQTQGKISWPNMTIAHRLAAAASMA
jgi:uncharacterized alpha/beta hydrolase family protein